MPTSQAVPLVYSSRVVDCWAHASRHHLLPREYREAGRVAQTQEFWVPHPSILRVRFLIFPGVRSIKSWRVARLLASRRESASTHRRATATNELASDPTQSSAVPLPQAQSANVIEPRRSAYQLPLRQRFQPGFAPRSVSCRGLPRGSLRNQDRG